MKKKVAQICDFHIQNDNVEFYNRTQLFLFDALHLLPDTVLTDYEKRLIVFAKDMYLNKQKYSLDVFRSFRILLARKKYAEGSVTEEQSSAIDAATNFLTPFEEYEGGDEIHRPFALQYNIDFLIKANLRKKELKSLLIKHFG